MMLARLGNTIQIGPASLPLWILALFAGYGVSALVIRLVARPDKEGAKKANDLILNCLLIFLIAWKLSPLLFNFQQIIKQPLSLLYLPGGLQGSVLGIIAAIAYLVLRVVRKKQFALMMPLAIAFAGVGVTLALFGLVTLPSSDPPVAPSFQAAGLDGTTYSLEEYKGSVVILNFWASWCPPCRAELPELVAFADGLPAEGPVFLSINQISSEAGTGAVSEFADRNSINYPVILDHGNRIHSAYGVRGIPTTVVVGADGTVVARKVGAVTGSWLRQFAGSR